MFAARVARLLLFCSVCWYAAALHAQGAPGCGAPFAFKADRLTVPITVINDFIFLPAEVGGVRGKMMFDTGTRDALVLNDHLLKNLGQGQIKGQAHVGSGQRYTVTIRNCVHGVSVAGSPAADVPGLESNDLGFIEKDITPDFLGFVGFNAYPGYAFRLDYARRQLSFEHNATGTRPHLLDDQKMLAALPFTTRRRPNDPFVPVKIGGHAFLAAFDTGQGGLLEMSDALRSALLADGTLVALPGKDDDGTSYYRVNHLELAPGVEVTLPAMTVHPTGSLADKGTGVTEPAVIYLGYQFLSQFKTVWDWPNHILYVLQP